MRRVVESICPPRLGRDFRWLLASSWSSNLGDGIALAAGPLLVASETHDPLLVAMAALLQRLPWLLFGLYAGVVADRFDRRRIVMLADFLRACVLVALAVTIVSGTVSVALVLATMFILGTAEAFTDITTSTLLPMLVESRDLGIANARLIVGHITANQLLGPPIGALLFAIGTALPFFTQAIMVALGVVLISRIRSVTRPVETPMTATLSTTTQVAATEGAWRQIIEGIRWLWHHAPIRTLAITIVTFNVTFGAAWSVLVLYSSERLGMGAVGFGLLATMSAIGGVLGSWSYGWIEHRVSLADIMRIGLVIETLTHLTLAVTTSPAVALGVFLIFGAHAAVWGTTATSIRQRAVPTEFQGRVGSVYMIGVQAGLVVGAAAGGLIARRWGITAPFWFAFVGSACLLAGLWQSLANIAHDDEAGAAASR